MHIQDDDCDLEIPEESDLKDLAPEGTVCGTNDRCILFR